MFLYVPFYFTLWTSAVRSVGRISQSGFWMKQQSTQFIIRKKERESRAWNGFTRRMAGCCLRLSIFLCDFSHLCLSLDYQVTFLPSLTLSPCIITSLARSTWDSLYWRRRRERTHTPSPLGVCVWKERKKQQQQHNPSPFRLLLTFFLIYLTSSYFECALCSGLSWTVTFFTFQKYK